MIGITVTTKGLDKVINMFEKLPENLNNSISETINDAAEMAKEYAETFCPEDTGELHDSIYVTIGEDNFELGATAKHAVFNEYGCYNLNCGSPEAPETAKYKGIRPFIRPSLIEVMRIFPDIFSKKFQRTMHG